jgi:hypothetical protein
MSDMINGWEAFKTLWGLVMTGVGVLAVRQMNRIDKLEETAVAKEDHKLEVTRLREDHQRNVDRVEKSTDALRAEMQNGFNRIFTRLDEIADRIK